MASSCQLSTSLSDIFFLKSPFFWMLRLLAAKFSRSVRVPADSVEWMLADTDRVEPGDNGRMSDHVHDVGIDRTWTNELE